MEYLEVIAIFLTFFPFLKIETFNLYLPVFIIILIKRLQIFRLLRAHFLSIDSNNILY